MFKRIMIGAVALGMAQIQPSTAQELTKAHFNIIGTASFMPLYAEQERPFWVEKVTEASGGSFTATITPYNEAGLQGPEVLRLLEQGVSDIATPILGYLAADDPLNEAIDLAGIAPTVEEARAVSEAWEPILDARYRENNNATVLGVLAYPSQVMFCRDAFEGLADIRGRKVRTGNRSLAEFVEALGGVSVTMPIGDVVPSLERGVVDCAITGSLTGYQQKWFDVVDHLYGLNLGWSQQATVMSLKKWDDLSPESQTFIKAQYDAFEDDVWTRIAEQTEEGFDCLTGRAECSLGDPASMTLVEVSPEDRAVLARTVKEVVIPAWIDRCGEECVADWNRSIGEVIDAPIAR